MRNLTAPPEFGELVFELDIPPSSIQAKKVTKAELVSEIRRLTGPLEYIFLGDLQLEVEWFANPKVRFESDKSPDVDNILKPIIDALCGPNGVLIDDCQLQSVLSYWMYNYNRPEHFHIRLKYIPDEWTKKQDLAFVQFDDALCLPLEMNLPKEAQRMMVSAYREGFTAREHLIELNVHDSYCRGILPTFRVFHRTRIRDFRVLQASDFEK